MQCVDPIQPIDLVAHPEGGRFRQIYKSLNRVKGADGRHRSALTHIYFSLGPGEVSHFHRVGSDEVWNLYQGQGVRLYLWEGDERPPACITLAAAANCFCHVVPAGTWQAAEPVAGRVLVGCSVAPGFEYTDFELMDLHGEAARRLAVLAPEMARFVVG